MALSRKHVVFFAALVFAFVFGFALSGLSADAKRRPVNATPTVIEPIKRVSCPERTYTDAFFGRLFVNVTTKPVWLLSAEVDCGQWSGPSNPTKLANVGPFRTGVLTPEGFKNPFRLEVGSASRPQWKMRIAKKSADGKLVKITAFRLTFAPWPKRTGYRGLFLCFASGGKCNDVTSVKKCPSTDPKNVGCGFPPDPPRQITAERWMQQSIVYRTPAVGGLKPLVIFTESFYNTRTRDRTFEINVVENSRLG